MNLLRSEKMGFYTLVMPKESALDILDSLGSVSLLQFIDPEGLGSNFKRDFTLWIRRCEELLLKLVSISNEMKKYGKDIIKTDDYKSFLSYMSQEIRQKKVSHLVFFDQVEQEIDEKMNYMNDQLKQFEDINLKRNNLLANRAVLLKAKEILLESKFSIGQNYKISESQKLRKSGNLEIEMKEIKPIEISNISLNYMVGVIQKEDILRFKRILFRVTKGNIFSIIDEISFNLLPIEQRDVKDSKNLFIMKKAFFIIIYQSGDSGALTNKLTKICDSFGADRFELPKSFENFQKKLDQIELGITDTENLYNLTKIGIDNCLENFSELNKGKLCSVIEEYRMFIIKELQLYQNMNYLKEKNHIYHGYCWLPQIYEDQVIQMLTKIGKSDNNIVTGQLQESNLGSSLKPPTYFRINEFTSIFQEIVNTYGIPRYQEVNPGLFTIILFPFLFGVMFGDIGHGFIVLSLGCYLMSFKETIAKENSVLKPLLPVRYLISLMGLFACFCGFIYNDMMSLTLDFGTCYNLESSGTTQYITRQPDCVYLFGVDPVWAAAENDLTFYNSLKMKLAVIIGVLQMLFGILLKGLNNINDRKPLDFFFEFIPQILLMSCLFGYMDLLIIIKWLTDWSMVDTSNAPSIINIMIDIPLEFGSLNGYAIWGEDNEQETVQKLLLIIIISCALVMLLFKPVIMAFMQNVADNIKPAGHKYQHGGHQLFIEEDEFDEPQQHQNPEIVFKISPKIKKNDEHENLPFGELLIYQAIETIEFVLGSISNTASYLRLWALSLAHSQLSQVFFEKILETYIEDGDILMIIGGFFIYANVSLAVLMGMDSLECFLHALRLQWVEWQNKFFKADGYKFQAFSFTEALLQSESP